MSETLELYEKLKYAREILAEEVKLGPSVLIGAVPLWIVAKRQPTSREDYLKIKGVTPQNLNLFFEGFDAVIHSHQTGRDLPKLWRFLDTIYLREEDKRQASAEAKKARIAEEKRRAKEVKRVTLAEEEKRRAEGDERIALYNAFESRGRQWLYYFSNIKAAPSILTQGIYSRNSTRNSNVKIFDFSNQKVQRRRKNVKVQLNDLRTYEGHDVVPFYFVTKTPTLSAVRHLNDKFVFWRVNISIIKQTGIVYGFSDGNLGSGQTKTYFKTEDVEKIDFANLNAPNWTDYPQGKNKRAAEMLIYDRVDPNFIDPRVCVYSNDSKKELLEILGPRAKEIDIHIGGEEYFFE